MPNFKEAYEFIKDKEKQKEYNDKIVNKTWYYQNKFGFKTSPQKGHEFWNNEADAFKHAFGSADLSLRYSNALSLGAGIYHENLTPNNPPREWNMDSWNNYQGREIAKEINREYGKGFMKLSQQEQDDIIAVKVISRMRNKKLITNPTDVRDYNGHIEKFIYTYPEAANNIFKNFLGINKTTGQAAPINQNQSALFGYTNPLTGSNKIFTREDVGAMTSEEFAKYEKEIDAQIRAFKGTMPTNEELQNEIINGGGVIYVAPYTRSDGTMVKGYYRSRPAH